MSSIHGDAAAIQVRWSVKRAGGGRVVGVALVPNGLADTFVVPAEIAGCPGAIRCLACGIDPAERPCFVELSNGPESCGHRPLIKSLKTRNLSHDPIPYNERTPATIHNREQTQQVQR